MTCAFWIWWGATETRSKSRKVGLCQLSVSDEMVESFSKARVGVTYSSVFAESLFEVAVSSALAQTRDVEVVAGVVVTIVALSTVYKSKTCQGHKYGVALIMQDIASQVNVPYVVVLTGAGGRARSFALTAGRSGSAPWRGASAAVPGSVVGFAGGVSGGVAVPLLCCWMVVVGERQRERADAC